MMRAAKQPPSVQSVREVAQDVQAAVCGVRFRRASSGAFEPCWRGSWRTR